MSKNQKPLPDKFEVNLEIDSTFSASAGKIDSFFQSRYERGLFNGTVLFAQSGRVVYKNAFGFANFKTKDSLHIYSPFQLASVSKPITAYAILLLQHQGLLTVQDSIRHFFPDFPYENITIEQLLIHRSGLPNYMYFADDYWGRINTEPISNDDVIEIMKEYEPKPNYNPGRRYNYCNTNYAILASIVQKVSGVRFGVFVEREIFKPLGMNDSYVYNKTIVKENGSAVKGFVSRNREADNTYLNGVVGDKGIYSSVEDLFKFDQALRKGRIIPLEELQQAYIPRHKKLYRHDNYGYGWRISTLSDSSKIVHHAGWWKGFRTYFIRDLKNQKTIIVLSNRSRLGHFSTKELMNLFEIDEE
ncbi:MAG: beta-lactamase family protein [Bacteroidetes bacterium]|nr:beta-lactamase family protein [Bacteroidota bacterium]MBU2507753.1 beta-lactamase family protein [Bacteroidota bacterium]